MFGGKREKIENSGEVHSSFVCLAGFMCGTRVAAADVISQ